MDLLSARVLLSLSLSYLEVGEVKCHRCDDDMLDATFQKARACRGTLISDIMVELPTLSLTLVRQPVPPFRTLQLRAPFTIPQDGILTGSLQGQDGSEKD